MPITMKDVARKANVSVGTVSNYVNGKDSVRPLNRKKIEEAILALGYQVNEVARHLKLRSSQTIGVIIPTFSNVFAVRTISHLERIFREKGFSLQVFSYDNCNETLVKIINSLTNKYIEGLIIMPFDSMSKGDVERINALIQKNIPVVVFDSEDEGVLCDHIMLNNYQMMKRITNMLFEMGHENIAFVLGPREISSTRERLKAYIDAHREKGISLNEGLIVHTDYSKKQSRQGCQELLDRYPDISVVLTAGYRITLGVLSTINGKNLVIPRDISVLGFDIMDISDILPFKLTGIYIPTEEVAKAIAEIILKRINRGLDDLSYKGVIELGFIEGNSIRRNEDINELFK